MDSAGDIIELDAWAPHNAIQQVDDLNAGPENIHTIARVSGDYNGPKEGYEYNVIQQIGTHTQNFQVV